MTSFVRLIERAVGQADLLVVRSVNHLGLYWAQAFLDLFS